MMAFFFVASQNSLFIRMYVSSTLFRVESGQFIQVNFLNHKIVVNNCCFSFWEQQLFVYDVMNFYDELSKRGWTEIWEDVIDMLPNQSNEQTFFSALLFHRIKIYICMLFAEMRKFQRSNCLKCTIFLCHFSFIANEKNLLHFVCAEFFVLPCGKSKQCYT